MSYNGFGSRTTVDPRRQLLPACPKQLTAGKRRISPEDGLLPKSTVCVDVQRLVVPSLGKKHTRRMSNNHREMNNAMVRNTVLEAIEHHHQETVAARTVATAETSGPGQAPSPDTRESFYSAPVGVLSVLHPCVCCFDALMRHLYGERETPAASPPPPFPLFVFIVKLLLVACFQMTTHVSFITRALDRSRVARENSTAAGHPDGEGGKNSAIAHMRISSFDRPKHIFPTALIFCCRRIGRRSSCSGKFLETSRGSSG